MRKKNKKLQKENIFWKKLLILIILFFIKISSYSEQSTKCLAPFSKIKLISHTNKKITTNENILEINRFRNIILKKLTKNKKVIIRVTGSPGTGKTTIAKILKQSDWSISKKEIALIKEEQIHKASTSAYKRLTIVEGIGSWKKPDSLTNYEIIHLAIHADLPSRIVHMFIRNIFTPWRLIEDLGNKIYLNFSGSSNFSIDTSYSDEALSKKQIKEILNPKKKRIVFLKMLSFLKNSA